jgi:hypothetical protein
MPTNFGYNHILGYGEESTWGTGVSATKYVRVTEESLAIERPLIEKSKLRGTSLTTRILGKQSVSGSFTFEVLPTGVELLFKHAFGALGTTGTNPYTHAMTLTDALPTGLSILVARSSVASSCERYTGCQINKLTLKQDMDDTLKATVDIIGKDAAMVAIPTPTYAADAPLKFSDVSTFSFNSVTYSVREFEFTLENNLDDGRFFLGSLTRGGIGRKSPRTASAKFTIELDSPLAGIPLLYSGGTGGSTLQVIWAGTAFTLAMLNCSVWSLKTPVNNSGVITQEVELRSFQSATANDEATCAFINATASP